MFAATRAGVMVSKVIAVVPYRYWRIYITALNSGGTQLAIGEVELRAVIGGSDITSGATPVTESSVFFDGEGGSYPGTATVDGNTGTYWTGGASVPEWVRYDLGSAQAVAQVAISVSGVAAECPRDFKIQGSADGTNFTDVKAFSGVSAWYGWQAFTL